MTGKVTAPEWDSVIRRLRFLRDAQRWVELDTEAKAALERLAGREVPSAQQVARIVAARHLLGVSRCEEVASSLQAAAGQVRAAVSFVNATDELDGLVLLLGQGASPGLVQVAGVLRGADVARPDLALVVLEEAGRVDPRNGVCLVVAVAARLDLGDLTDAEEDLDDAVRLGADRVYVETVRRRLWRMTGESEDSEDEAWGGTVDRAPATRQLRIASVQRLLRDGEWQEAKHLAIQLLDERENREVLSLLHHAQFELGEWPKREARISPAP